MLESGAIADRPQPYAERDLAPGAGGLDAFEALYRSNVGRVYAICMRMTGNPTRAEELTQEAFIHAWKKLGTFRGEAQIGSWLRKIAVNTVLGDRRSQQRRNGRERELAASDSFPQSVSTDAGDHGLDLEKAISGLPEGARTVFVLHDVEGYRHSEIAKMLDIAVGTTKTQLHRARKLLREALRR